MPRRRACRRSAHNVLLLGLLGVGTSRLARRLTTSLPAMTLAEALATTRLHHVTGLTGARTALVTTRPFRAPHHTISDVGLIGGGQVPTPGEVSLAHHGVRCLDARPEYWRPVREVSFQPLENGITAIPFPGRHSACSSDRPSGGDICAERLTAMTGGRDNRKGHSAAQGAKRREILKMISL
jgi:predicted ATPase with chaperone activity